MKNREKRVVAGREIEIARVERGLLKPAPYNPRKWDEGAIEQLMESIRRFGIVDPLIVNRARKRYNVVIGGHMRLEAAARLGYNEMPVVYVDVPDEARERELNLRLNRNQGEWDWDALADFGEDLLADVGFTKNELDDIFGLERTEEFDVAKEVEQFEPQSGRIL